MSGYSDNLYNWQNKQNAKRKAQDERLEEVRAKRQAGLEKKAEALLEIELDVLYQQEGLIKG